MLRYYIMADLGDFDLWLERNFIKIILKFLLLPVS